MELPCASEVTRKTLMLPPSPGTFQNRDDLISYVRDFGVGQGYVVTIRKSKKDRRVILGCDRGGTYRNRRSVEEMKRKRKASSRLINCPFEAIGKRDDDVWVLTIKNGEHNHEPLEDMSEHPYSRRFTEEEVKQIMVMTEAGVKPLEVLKALKESNPELRSTARHLYNVKAKIRQGFPENSLKSWRPNLSVTVCANTKKSSSAVPIPNFIGGRFLESQACEFIDVINPATQEVGSQVPMTTFEEFRAAVVAAKQAYPAWKDRPVSARQRIMFKLQELIRRDIDQIAMNITTEQGKTFNSAKADVLNGLELVERACGLATLLMGKYIPNVANGIDTFCTREPLGVCAGMCLSDFPAMIPLWMFPVAVICGNTFILKPTEKNPGVSMMIATLATEAGLPDGVLNIIHGNHEIAKNICEGEDIKAILFTSSNVAGRDIYARAAATGKRVESNMEVKYHIIIMPDARADAALDTILASSFGASGTQRSMAPSVAVFVGGSSQWEQELVERAKDLKVNAGKEPGTDIGPIFSKEAKNRICRLVESGICSGARLVLDGRHIVVPRYEQGNFLGPTILCDVTTSMDCYKEEEMVGPILLCMQAENLEEAIAIVNSTKLVSGASIFTSSSVAARKFQNEVETNLVGINVPIPLSLPVSTNNASNIAGDLNYLCGKAEADVHFYTRSKSVVQRWKYLPEQRAPLAHLRTFETETSSQGVAKAMPSGITEPYDNSNPSFPPSAKNDSPIPGPAMSIPEIELPGQEGPDTLPSVSRHNPMNQDPFSERLYMPPVSNMVDVVVSTEPGEDAMNMGLMSFQHDGSQIPERHYLPLISQQNENVVSSSRRSEESTQPNTNGFYSSVSQANDTTWTSFNGEE